MHIFRLQKSNAHRVHADSHPQTTSRGNVYAVYTQNSHLYSAVGSANNGVFSRAGFFCSPFMHKHMHDAHIHKKSGVRQAFLAHTWVRMHFLLICFAASVETRVKRERGKDEWFGEQQTNKKNGTGKAVVSAIWLLGEAYIRFFFNNAI